MEFLASKLEFVSKSNLVCYPQNGPFLGPKIWGHLLVFTAPGVSLLFPYFMRAWLALASRLVLQFTDIYFLQRNKTELTDTRGKISRLKLLCD